MTLNTKPTQHWIVRVVRTLVSLLSPVVGLADLDWSDGGQPTILILRSVAAVLMHVAVGTQRAASATSSSTTPSGVQIVTGDPDTLIMPEGTKTCSRCRAVRPLGDFPRRPGTPDGHRGVCTPCKSAQRRAQYTIAHPNGPGRGNGRKQKIDPNRTEKTCSTCGIIKPMSDYHRHAAAPDGRRAECKDCGLAKRASGPKRQRPGVAPERRGKRGPIPGPPDPDRALRTWLRNEYGITLDEYNAMHDAQGGLCLICKEPCDRHARLSVDHSHTTGKIRGLLCDRCNKVLGLFRDDPATLRTAAIYLRTAEEVERDAA